MRVVVRVTRADEDDAYPKGFKATCLTSTDCDWSYANVIRSDVEDQARWHRQDHRRAATIAGDV